MIPGMQWLGLQQIRENIGHKGCSQELRHCHIPNSIKKNYSLFFRFKLQEKKITHLNLGKEQGCICLGLKHGSLVFSNSYLRFLHVKRKLSLYQGSSQYVFLIVLDLLTQLVRASARL